MSRRKRVGRQTTHATGMLAGAALAAYMLDDAGWITQVCAVLWWVAVVVIVRSDLERFVIPDEASLVIAVLGLTHAVALPLWYGSGFPECAESLLGAALTGLAGFTVFWLVGQLYRQASGREGLGRGDVKLAGASAIWLMPGDAALAVEVAAMLGLAVLLWRRRATGERDIALPFGAFLAPAAWLAFVMGPSVHALMDGRG